MKRVPHSQAVARALRAARSAVNVAWKGVNGAAAKAIARGDYEAGQELAEKGRGVQKFLEAVEGLRREWRGISRGAGRATDRTQSKKLALWEYYQPILAALIESGGAASRSQIEPIVERLLASRLSPRDRETMSGGRLRWQRCILLARRSMRAEGWIEEGLSPTWKITAAGRSAAAGKAVPGKKV